jgi:hypothetical protein
MIDIWFAKKRNSQLKRAYIWPISPKAFVKGLDARSDLLHLIFTDIKAMVGDLFSN